MTDPVPAVVITCDCRPPREDGIARRPLQLGDLAVIDGSLIANIGAGSFLPDAAAHRSVWIDSLQSEGVDDGVRLERRWHLANITCPSCRLHLERNADDMARKVEAMHAAAISSVSLSALIAALA